MSLFTGLNVLPVLSAPIPLIPKFVKLGESTYRPEVVVDWNECQRYTAVLVFAVYLRLQQIATYFPFIPILEFFSLILSRFKYG